MFAVRSFRGVLAFLMGFWVLASGLNAAPPAGIAWQKDVQTAVRESARQRKPLLVLVDARWCGACQKMLRQTFPDPALAWRIGSQFIPVRIDADEQAGLVQSLKVEAMPTLLIVSPERREIGRMTGFQSAAQLSTRLAGYRPMAPMLASPAPRSGAPRPAIAAPPVPKPPREFSAPVPMPPEERSARGGPLGTLEAALRFSTTG